MLLLKTIWTRLVKYYCKFGRIKRHFEDASFQEVDKLRHRGWPNSQSLPPRDKHHSILSMRQEIEQLCPNPETTPCAKFRPNSQTIPCTKCPTLSTTPDPTKHHGRLVHHCKKRCPSVRASITLRSYVGHFVPKSRFHFTQSPI